ncbi:hypothetical protein CHARACLAT_033440, partial [Characodon lateralis]|nr:hypothetical protein [Characodon lateralis]
GETVHSLRGAALCHSLLLKKEKTLMLQHRGCGHTQFHKHKSYLIKLVLVQILISTSGIQGHGDWLGCEQPASQNSPAHKFLLSLHSNHPNATLRQDDNFVNSS